VFSFVNRNDDFFEFGGSAQSVAPKIESKKAVEVPPAPPKKITIAPVIVQNSNKSAGSSKLLCWLLQ
jgi:hypothetical protein